MFPSPLLPLLLLLPFTWATVFQTPFSNCLTTTGASSNSLINITTVYAQLVSGEDALRWDLPGGGRNVLRLDMLGETESGVVGFDNVTGKLATMFTTTTSLSYTLYTTTTYVCNSLFPPSPLPTPYFPQNTTYCPIPGGPLALNFSIPLDSGYALSTLMTNIRIVDTAIPPNPLLCINITLSPFYPTIAPYYLFLYLPVALVVAYFIVTWSARFAAGWAVGSMGSGEGDGEVGWGRKGGWGRRVGTMWVSGLSGERLGVSGGLLRFVTPGLKDIIHHLQFCAVLGMVAVNWPGFAYPILAKSAWASLIWKVALVQGANASSKLIDPSRLPSTSYPNSFSPQINSATNPLYLSPNSPAPFLNLGGARPGMESFAAAVGLRTMDLYGTNIVLFLALSAGTLVLSLFIWVLHGVLTSFIGTSEDKARKRSSWGQSPRASSLAVNGGEMGKRIGTPSTETPMLGTQNGTGAGVMATRPPQGTPGRGRRLWWRFKVKGPVGAYHWNALCGNLVRILILFHLPLTVFSVFQWSIRDDSPVAVTVLSALSFAIFSILIPIYLLIRVATTATAKLYDATRTLLSLGPLYNIYAQGSQLYPALTFSASLATGIVVGAGQKSGIAQAIVLLGIEIAMGVVTTIWQPWGGGSGMGVPGFLFMLVRVVSLVLLLVMSPQIDIASTAIGWVAYVLLGLQALMFIIFLIMLLCKILEGFIRLFGQLKFDESKHPLDGGLYAAFGGISGKARRERKQKRASLQRSTSSGAGSTNTQMMLDKHSTQRGSKSNPEVGYFPPVRPLSNGSEIMGYAREGEMGYSGGTPPVSRGFSVLRGGKADYERPYDVVPRIDEGQQYARPPSAQDQYHALPVQPIRTSFTPNQAGPSRLAAPVAAPAGSPVRHGRTKSQTAIIETLPGSQNPSPTNLYPPSDYFAGASSRAAPVPLALQRIERDDRAQRDSSPTSAYSGEDIPDPVVASTSKPAKRTSKPSTWFGKSSKDVGGQWSDSEDEGNSDFGPKGKGRAGTEPMKGKTKTAGGSGGWLSALKGGKSSSQSNDTGVINPVDERRVDENAMRKSMADATELSSLPKPTQPDSTPVVKSFKVNRPNRPGSKPSSRATPQFSQSTPPAVALGPPVGDQPPTQAAPRGFVVSRPPTHTRRASTPSALSPPPAATGSPQPEQTRSFVVNRPSAPTRLGSSETFGGGGEQAAGLPQPVGWSALTGYESDRSSTGGKPPRPVKDVRRSLEGRGSYEVGRGY